jgi:hypothetical protein
MTEPVLLTSDSPILAQLNFKPYRYITIRHVKQFLPQPHEPQSMEIKTPWGAILNVKSGDMLLSEMDKPDDIWSVDAEIFNATYIITEPGYCIKAATTLLVPLKEVVNGNEEAMVTVETLEGPETVPAGKFYLAKGIKGEIWPLPNEKVDTVMKPVE